MAPRQSQSDGRRDRRQRPPLPPAAPAHRRGLRRRLGAGYIERAVEAGRAPWFGKVLTQGTNLLADCVVPSFTNPNNLSIVTGRPPAEHGICGTTSSIRERERGDDERPEVPAHRDAVPVVPARRLPHCRHHRKDKLRGLLGKGLELGVGKACSFSSEKSDKANVSENGIDKVNELVGIARARRLQRRSVGVRIRGGP